MVAMGYRLGGLGFMAMPELTAESDNASSGNYGLLDQIFALKWIKRNINAFGASQNPRVVVFGQSAGAYDISEIVVDGKFNIWLVLVGGTSVCWSHCVRVC